MPPTKDHPGRTLHPGDIVGQYVLDRPLGTGAFGQVWLARHADLDRRFALKIPTDAAYLRLLRQEGRAICELRHPNIVAGIDVNTLHDPPYVVMEYVEGVTLRDKLRAVRTFSPADAMKLLRQIFAGLAYAHEQGVLHRDIKPENVLLTSGGVAKLADFGLGNAQTQLATSILLSGNQSSAAISGTIHYMSPQQQAGAASDARDDLYSLGIVTCELLAGERPGVLGVEKLLRRAGVPSPLVQAIEKALEPEPADRYASVQQMQAAFEQALTTATASPAVTTSPPAPRAPASPPPPPKPSPNAPASPAPVRPDDTEFGLTLDLDDDDEEGSQVIVLEDKPPAPQSPPPPPRLSAGRGRESLADIGIVVEDEDESSSVVLLQDDPRPVRRRQTRASNVGWQIALIMAIMLLIMVFTVITMHFKQNP